MCRTDAWGRGCFAGLQFDFPWIRTVMADAGYESGKLARLIYFQSLSPYL